MSDTVNEIQVPYGMACPSHYSRNEPLFVLSTVWAVIEKINVIEWKDNCLGDDSVSITATV